MKLLSFAVLLFVCTAAYESRTCPCCQDEILVVQTPLHTRCGDYGYTATLPDGTCGVIEKTFEECINDASAAFSRCTFTCADQACLDACTRADFAAREACRNCALTGHLCAVACSGANSACHTSCGNVFAACTLPRQQCITNDLACRLECNEVVDVCAKTCRVDQRACERIFPPTP